MNKYVKPELDVKMFGIKEDLLATDLTSIPEWDEEWDDEEGQE